MNFFEALFLGILQGVTEFFPISSSGHLAIFQGIFGIKEPMIAFDIFLHLGTLVSILIFFYKDILELFTSRRKTIGYLVAACIPTFAMALLFKDSVEEAFGAPKIVGVMLVITGIWLALASAVSKYTESRGRKKDLGLVNSVVIGIAQGIAIFPGISRSGSTIATGMIAGLDKEKAFRFSFLLSVPAILGACVFKIKDIAGGVTNSDALFFLAGGIAAMVTGLVAIKVLLNIIRKDKFYIFSVYCILVGAAVAIFYKG